MNWLDYIWSWFQPRDPTLAALDDLEASLTRQMCWERTRMILLIANAKSRAHETRDLLRHA